MKGTLCLVICVCIAVFSACSKQDTIPVAIMTKLESGSIVGSSEIDAARLFLEDRQIKNIEIFPVNDGWEPDKAKLAYEEVKRRGIKLLITSHVSTCAIAISDAINNDRILTLVTGAATDKLSGKNDFIFRNIQDVRAEQKSIAEHINALPQKRVLIVRDTDNHGYTDPALHHFRDNLKKPVSVIDISIAKLDLGKLKEQMRREDFDLLYLLIGGYKSAAGSIAQLAKQIRPRAAIMFTPWVKTPSLIETAGSAIKGTIIPSHYPPRAGSPAVNGYMERFKNKFGYSPTFISLNVYTALQIISDAIAAGNPTPEAIRNHIITKKTFTTDFGTITFDEFGDVQMPLYYITDLTKEF